MGNGKAVYSSQVLNRVMQILDALGQDGKELSFAELARKVGLHKSTLYRLLEAVRSHGLVGFNQATGKYHLGMTLFRLGMQAVGRLEISNSASPALERLMKQTGETAHVCILDGSDVVYIAKFESDHILRTPSTVGMRNPAYCTAGGKAILAHLSEREAEDYIKSTPLRPFAAKTITSAAALRKELLLTRTRGYSVNDQEFSDAIRCIGAPIYDYTGKVAAAVSIAGPSTRVTKAKVPKLARYVIEAADSISASLGYRPQGKPLSTDEFGARG